MKLPNIASSRKLPISLLAITNKKLPLLLVFAMFLSTLLASCQDKYKFENINLSKLTPQQIAEYTKPSVVRVEEGCSAKVLFKLNNKTYDLNATYIGSGFFVDSKGYIVTTAYVTSITHQSTKTNVQDACEPEIFSVLMYEIASELRIDPADFTDEQKQQIWDNMVYASNIQLRRQVVTPKGKELSFDIKAIDESPNISNLEGKDVSVIKVNLDNVPILEFVKDSNQVDILDSVNIIGYPIADNSTQRELPPTFTDGKMSAKKSLNDGSPIFQINAQIDSGYLGAPVINHEGKVIGIVRQGEGSGISYVVPGNIVMEFVRQAGATNKLTEVNELYLEGIVLYGDKKYKEALKKFEAVKKLYSEHSDVDRLIKESQKRS